MENKYNLLFITVFILLIHYLIVFITLIFFKNKVTYIYNVKIFNIINKLKNGGEEEFNALNFDLAHLYSKLQSSHLSYLEKKEELNQFHFSFGHEQSSKIWARIKSYSSEFSEKKEHQPLICSRNKTSVLFADENIYVTNDLLPYLNKKHHGLK